MSRTKGSKNKTAKSKAKKFMPEAENIAPEHEKTPAETVGEGFREEADAKMPQSVNPVSGESEKERWARIGARRDAAKEARESLGSLGEQKLVAPTREGFFRYWVNDDGNRLAEVQNKGYDFVRKGSEGTENVFSTDPGDNISQLVGMTKTNEPMRAYLMEIPEGWRNEDQQSKENARRSVEDDLRRVAHGGSQSSDGSSVMYTPSKGPSHFDA